MKIKKSNIPHLKAVFSFIIIAYFVISNPLWAQADAIHNYYYQVDKELFDNNDLAINNKTINNHFAPFNISQSSKTRKDTKDNTSVAQNAISRKGYMSFMSIGFLPGGQEVLDFTPISLDMSHGFYDSSGWYTGFGLAVETFDPPIMPVFTELRKIFITKGAVRPWLRGTAGYSIALASKESTSEKGGLMAGIGGGLNFEISSRSQMYVYLGYRYHELKSIITDWSGNETKQITKYNRMEFRLGLSFH